NDLLTPRGGAGQAPPREDRPQLYLQAARRADRARQGALGSTTRPSSRTCPVLAFRSRKRNGRSARTSTSGRDLSLSTAPPRPPPSNLTGARCGAPVRPGPLACPVAPDRSASAANSGTPAAPRASLRSRAPSRATRGRNRLTIGSLPSTVLKPLTHSSTAAA